MQFSAYQIASIIEGRVEGDESVAISALAKIEEAKEGELSFVSNPKYEHFLYTTNASNVILDESLKVQKPVKATLIRVKNPYSAFSKLLDMYNSFRLDKKGIESPVYISEDAIVGKDVYLGAFAYVGRGVHIGDNCKIYPHVYIGDHVRIGEGTTLFPGVRVYCDCVIGKQVIIHSGAVIGSD